MYFERLGLESTGAHMHVRRLIFSLAAGFASALWSWWFFGEHFVPHFGRAWDLLGILIVVLSIPGLLSGMIAGGNVHAGTVLLTALVNFLFYFLTASFAFTIWQKRRKSSGFEAKRKR
jgi:drug/metabolite transporter (DMT)-like permease